MAIIPVFTVEKIELEAIIRAKNTIGPKSKKKRPFKMLSHPKFILEPNQMFKPTTDKNMMELYITIMVPNPINFPNTSSYLFIGLDKIEYIVPLSISPDMAFTDVRTTRKATIKFAKKRPADKICDSTIMSNIELAGRSNILLNPKAYMER